MTVHKTNGLAEMTRPSREFPRAFVPNEIDLSNWDNLEPLYKELIDRPLGSRGEVEKWLLDQSELGAAVSEESSRRNITMTCNTEDAEAEKAFLHFIENIQPRLRPVGFALEQKLVGSPYLHELDPNRYGLLIRAAKNDIELFREENIPLDTELSRLSQQYQKLSGSLTVKFLGEERTMQQMGAFLEDKDRSLRESAFRVSSERRLQEAEKFEELFDKMLKLRIQVAKNADLPDFRAYMFKTYERFDYTPEHCLQFHDAVEKIVVPVNREILGERKQAMGIDRMKPWDTACDMYGRDPLRPFDTSSKLASGSQSIFHKVDPELGGFFQSMIDTGLLDLDSRKGKAPGGYQSTLDELRLPFIFMNAVGTNRDLFTLLHEGGHSFHSMLARHEPLAGYRHGPMEFCEVASMAMEHLSLPYLSVFYNDSEAARAKREHLEGDLGILPWIAIIDAFQHWIYTHPEHTGEERSKYWVSLMERFSSGVDYSGFEEVLKYRWHTQLHIFEVPFYYIEYGIALLGALQVWRNARMDQAKAVKAYKKALALGGSQPLPMLFEAADIKFDFSANTIQPLVEEVREELSKVR